MIAPQVLPGGERAWVDTEVREFTQRLTELDPSLALYQNPDKSWLIAQVSEDGGVHYIMRSKPGARLGPQVLQKLSDGRNGTKVVERMIARNDRITKEAEEAEIEAKFVAVDNILSKTWRGRVPSNIQDQDI